MIALDEHAEGIVLRVRAQPAARRSAITGQHDGALKIAVAAAPERGKANDAVVALLAKQLSLPKSAIRLLSGEASRRKRFLILGVSLDDLRARIEKALAEQAK
jgi:hypothetical protein